MNSTAETLDTSSEEHLGLSDPATARCPICRELRGMGDHNPAYRDVDASELPTVLTTTESFAVVPAVGALVPGYVLVVPRVHATSIGHLDQSTQTELASVVEALARELEREFDGAVVMFEHGACSPSRRGGACVDHAHIHVLPLPEAHADALAVDVRTQYALRPASPAGVDQAHYVRIGTPYLWMRDNSGAEFIGEASTLVSQAVRRRLAARLGVPDEWDWEVFPHVSRMHETVRRLERRLSGLHVA